MNNFQLLQNVFFDPGLVFSSIKKEPKSAFPLILSLTISTLVILFYFYNVDGDWLVNYLIEKDGMGDGAEGEMVLSKDLLLWLALAASGLGIIAIRFFEAIYYLLAGKFFGIEITFQYWFSLMCWANLPLVLIFIVSAVSMFFYPSGQVTQEQLNTLSLNEIFFQLPPEHGAFSLVSALTVVHMWVFWLYAKGIKVLTNKSLFFCWTFSLIPWIVFYGIWLLLVI